MNAVHRVLADCELQAIESKTGSKSSEVLTGLAGFLLLPSCRENFFDGLGGKERKNQCRVPLKQTGP